MKAALVQAAIPGSTGTQDITDSNISSDFRTTFSFGGYATATNTLTAHAAIGAGFTDGTAQCAEVALFEDGQNPTDCRSNLDDSFAYAVQGLNSSTTTAECAPSSVLSNGIRLNWTDIDAAQLVNHLLLSGSDLTATVKTAVLNGTTPVSVTHSLGGTPDVIIAIHHGGTDGALGSGSYSYGWWVRDDAVAGGVKYGHVTGRNGHGATTVACTQRTSTSKIAAYHTGTSPVYSVTIQNAGATTFEVVADAATTNLVGLLCLRGIAAATGVVNLPTGTGSTALISGLPSTAKAALFLLNQNTSSVETSSTSDTAGVFGIGVAVNNNGTIQQMSACMSSDDGIVTPSTSIEKCQTSNTQAIRILDVAGAADVEGAVTGMTTSVTVNFTNVNAAVPTPYLVLMDFAVAPSWDTVPSLGTATATTLPLNYDGATGGATTTFYAAATKVGTATPSAAQIKAASGGGILFGANEVITGGSDSTTLTISGTPYPRYDIHCLLSNSAGDSSIVTISRAFRLADAGHHFVAIGASPAGPVVEGLLAKFGYTVAQHDVFDWLNATRPNGHGFVGDDTGSGVEDTNGDTSRSDTDLVAYDESAGTLIGPHTVYFRNNRPVVLISSYGPTLEYNEAMTPVDFLDGTWASDADGDTLTVAVTSGSLPTGTSLVGGVWSGTPTVNEQTFSFELTFTDIADDTSLGVVAVAGSVQDTVAYPDVEGIDYEDGTAGDANSILVAAGLVPSLDFQDYDPDIPEGYVLEQIPDPDVTSTVLVGSTVSLKLSLGPEPPVRKFLRHIALRLGFGF